MNTQTQKPLEFWRELPSEDRAFYEEFVASAVVCAALVLLLG